MTEAEATWRDMEARLRPFVARRVASAADADDVLQDVFVRLLRGLGDVRHEERLTGWMFQVARSAIADHHRARARHPLARGEGPERVAEPLEPEDDVAESLAPCVALFVALLPSPYREAITLTELEGVPQKDAAAMLGLSVSGMKSRVQRGRAKLLAMFERACTVELDARRRVVACTPRACGPCPER